jgi:hypothetical protein
MAAGALTGALFKSTGELFSYLSCPFMYPESSCFSFVPSWGKACFGGSDCGLRICGSVELGKDPRLSLHYMLCNSLDAFVRDHSSVLSFSFAAPCRAKFPVNRLQLK